MANTKDLDWSNIALGLFAVGGVMLFAGMKIERNYLAPRRMKKENTQLATKKPQTPSKKA